MTRAHYPTVAESVGNTPLVRLQRLPEAGSGLVLVKLEGANPGGSVKDRAAFAMIATGEEEGLIGPGTTLVEATSGNTGIALAAAAAAGGYRIVLVIPAGSSKERALTMRALGAEIIESDAALGMEHARDVAQEYAASTGAVRLDQFAHPANPGAHQASTGPEIWAQTAGSVTHVVSAMGTTGTITGISRFLKSVAPEVRVIGVQPAPGARIPGIRAWPAAYVPGIFDPSGVDELRHVTQETAVQTTRLLARREGIFVGMSSGGAAAVALDIAREEPEATVVFIAPDRGDRYLSTDLFDG